MAPPKKPDGSWTRAHAGGMRYAFNPLKAVSVLVDPNYISLDALAKRKLEVLGAQEQVKASSRAIKAARYRGFLDNQPPALLDELNKAKTTLLDIDGMLQDKFSDLDDNYQESVRQLRLRDDELDGVKQTNNSVCIQNTELQSKNLQLEIEVAMHGPQDEIHADKLSLWEEQKTNFEELIDSLRQQLAQRADPEELAETQLQVRQVQETLIKTQDKLQQAHRDNTKQKEVLDKKTRRIDELKQLAAAELKKVESAEAAESEARKALGQQKKRGDDYRDQLSQAETARDAALVRAGNLFNTKKSLEGVREESRKLKLENTRLEAQVETAMTMAEANQHKYEQKKEEAEKAHQAYQSATTKLEADMADLEATNDRLVDERDHSARLEINTKKEMEQMQSESEQARQDAVAAFDHLKITTEHQLQQQRVRADLAESSLATLQASKDELEQENQQLHTELNKAESDTNTAQQQLAQTFQNVMERTQRVAQQQVEGYQSELKTLRERFKHTESELSSKKFELADAHWKLREAQFEHRTDNQRLVRDLEIETAKGDSAAALLRDQIEQQTSAQADLDAQLETFKERQERLVSECEQKAADLVTAQAALVSSRDQLSTLESAFAAQKEELTVANAGIDELEARLIMYQENIIKERAMIVKDAAGRSQRLTDDYDKIIADLLYDTEAQRQADVLTAQGIPTPRPPMRLSINRPHIFGPEAVARRAKEQQAKEQQAKEQQATEAESSGGANLQT